jgi:hypothetical protein
VPHPGVHHFERHSGIRRERSKKPAQGMNCKTAVLLPGRPAESAQEPLEVFVEAFGVEVVIPGGVARTGWLGEVPRLGRRASALQQRPEARVHRDAHPSLGLGSFDRLDRDPARLEIHVGGV